ncbi:hypothetical protein TWF481_002241 [Arthrobotrys musiformis]|uniref:F-box domain-containing protein n=1 Tax=Arthrobotrys musiformis TaxID=47236 RepID=A0AAV9VTU6_9PEZI
MASITTLPTELLLEILTQVLSSRSFKARDVARLASVCRRFDDVVVKYLYSNCDILLHRRGGLNSGHVITLPRFSGESIDDSLANARMTLEAYKNHGREVRFLSLKTTRGTILSSTTPYVGPITSTPTARIPNFTATLTTSFKSLTTLSLTDTLTTPLSVPTLISTISTILTTSLSLKHLSLNLTIIRSQESFEESQSSLLLLPKGDDVATLESLTIDLQIIPERHVPYWHRPRPGPQGNPVWLLSSLPSLFPQNAISSTKSLSFIVTGEPDTPPPPTPSQKLLLPSLESLTLSVTPDCPALFQQFIHKTPQITHLELRETFELKLPALITLLTPYKSLTTLTLKKLDSRRPPPLRFISHLKSTLLESLKQITLYTSTPLPRLKSDLGHIFISNTVQSMHRERIPPSERNVMHDGSDWRIIIEFAY